MYEVLGRNEKMDRQKIHLREEYNVKKPIFRNIHKIIV